MGLQPMPRASRRVPEGMNRFNYWNYDLAVPRQPVSSTRPPLGQAAHEYCRDEFRSMLVGRSKEPVPIVAKRRTLLKCHLGRFVSNQQAFALGFYIECDKLWQQDRHAWQVMQTLPPGVQRKLSALERKRWHYQTRWTWPVLLQSIARDQEIFQQVLAIRPAGAGLAGPRGKIAPATRLKWQEYKYRPVMALKVYQAYRSQLTRLLKTRQSQQQALHWFAHALRNLTRYRLGHTSLAFTSSCASPCRRRQQNLCLRVI